MIRASASIIGVAFLFNHVWEVPLTQQAEALAMKGGWPGGAAIVLILGVDLILPIPSSLVMIMSGVLFGGVGGGLLSFFGSMLGNVAGFELARKYGLAFARRLMGKKDFSRLGHVLEQYGPLAIILSRPIPILMETLSLVAGITGMKRRSFLVSCCAGTVPVSFIYSFAGSLSLEWISGFVFPESGGQLHAGN